MQEGRKNRVLKKTSIVYFSEADYAEVCKLLLGFLAEAGTENSKGHVSEEQSLDYLILKEEGGEKGI